MLEFLDKYNRKKEVRRLENIKGDFLREYKDLCIKYRCQLVPRLLPLSSDQVKVIQQLDVYNPEVIEKARELLAQKQNGQENPQQQ